MVVSSRYVEDLGYLETWLRKVRARIEEIRGLIKDDSQKLYKD